MATEISQDIFFTVKKQILDKLDLILQRINLQLIQKSHSPQNFQYIQLSQFENQIAILFKYLDKLYQSLNTSVSLSNFDSFDSKIRQENQKLMRQNSQLKQVLSIRHCEIQSLKKQKENYLNIRALNQSDTISSYKGQSKQNTQQIASKHTQNNGNRQNKSIRTIQNQQASFLSFKQQSYCVFLLKDMLPKVRYDCQQMLQYLSQIRNQMKQYKFCILQSKIQFLSKIKDIQKNSKSWQEESYRQRNEISLKGKDRKCQGDMSGFSRRVLLKIEEMLQSN